MGGQVDKVTPSHGISSPHGWVRARGYAIEKCGHRCVELAWPVRCCAVARKIWVNAFGIDARGCKSVRGSGENRAPMRSGLSEPVEPNEADVRHCYVPRVVVAPG